MPTLTEFLNTDIGPATYEMGRLLYNLANTKLDFFNVSTVKMVHEGRYKEEKLKVPIVRALGVYRELYTYSGDKEEFREQINYIVDRSLKGDYVDGVAKLANKFAEPILDNDEAGEVMEKEVFFAALYPSIFRLDMTMWTYKIESVGMKKKLGFDKVIGIIIYKSLVDFERMEYNDLVNLLTPTINVMCRPRKSKKRDAEFQSYLKELDDTIEYFASFYPL